MEPGIVLYGVDGVPVRSVIPLMAILRPSMERILGRGLEQARLELLVYQVPDERALLDGDPVLVNLSGGFGYARVTVVEGGVVSYRHPHRVQEVLGQELQRVLREAAPTAKVWGFYLAVSGMSAPPLAVAPLDGLAMSRREAPTVQGSVAVAPYAPGEGPAFRIRKVEEPPPPLKSLDDFPLLGLGSGDADRKAFVKVLVPGRLHADLLEQRPFSRDLEEGGFLVGRVYRDRDAEGTYLLELTAALEAEHTGASLLHFTYTGDSFAALRRVLREEHPDAALLGWYHTHLFPATAAMGLSSIDLELHFTTFRQPWQLAGLINLDGQGPRVLRFYVRRETLMVPCPQWVLR